MLGRHLISVSDFSTDEFAQVLKLASELKKKRQAGQEHRVLAGKSLAMIFQKPSNRTRVSFEVGMYELGGQSLNIRPAEIDMGKRETIPDVARALSRYVHAVMLRALKHTDIFGFAKYSTGSVINGLSHVHHPWQVLADLHRFADHKGRISELIL